MAAILKVAMFLAIGCSFWWWCEKKNTQKQILHWIPGFPYSCSWIPSQKIHSLHLGLGWENPPDPSQAHLTRPISTQGRSEAVGYCSLNSVGPSFAKFSERTFTVERRWFGWRKGGEMVWIKVQEIEKTGLLGKKEKMQTYVGKMCV